MFKFVHKFLSSFKIRARISEISLQFFSFVFTNLYASLHVKFVHEIRTKFVIFNKLRKSSYEFARIHEGYVLMACTVLSSQKIFDSSIKVPVNLSRFFKNFARQLLTLS